MSNATELLRRAFEAWDNNEPIDFNDCMGEIRAFLAVDPEAEPVAWMHILYGDIANATINGKPPEEYDRFYDHIPLYRHPPRPEPARKPMTEDEVGEEILRNADEWSRNFANGFVLGVRFAEKHHGIGEDDE